ncbi:MAG: DinB family protein [Pseudomonadota bacterium]
MTQSPIDAYRQMALNNAWSNATLYSAIEGMSDADFAAPRPGFFGSLRSTLNHILDADQYFLNVLEKGDLGRSMFFEPEIEDVVSLANEQTQADIRLASFCSTLTPDTLLEQRQTVRREGPMTERIDALLLQLFQHQIHHRGQAHVQVQHAGIAPPQLDEFHLTYGRAPSAQAYFA